MGYALNYLRLQLGKLVFYLFEPIFQCWENRDSDIRVHLHQGLIYLDKGETAVALLNLNMVLSLKPNHFLALASRGRLFLKEGRSQLAAQDLLKANQVSAYRFSHYGLSSEYLRSLNKGVNNLGVPIVSNFTDMLEFQSKLHDVPKELGSSDVNSLSKERSTEEQGREESKEHLPAFKRLTFSELDHEKFDKLGSITQQEIDNTDWDQLIEDFTS